MSDAEHPSRVPFNVSQEIVSFAGGLSVVTLDRLREYLGGSLSWAGERFGDGAGTKLAGGLGISEGLQKTSEALLNAGDGTTNGLATAVEKTYEAFQTAFHALGQAGDYTYKTMFESVGVASVLGPSFDPLLKQEINLSFRAEGRDISADDAVEQFKASKLGTAVVLVPGLFCDEKIWHRPSPDGHHWADFFRERNIFPLSLRFHPGLHISENGRALNALLEEFTSKANVPLHFMSYSQGGLVLRSALYYAREEKKAWRKKVRKTLLVSSPDGGSYIEKIGFLVGNGLVAFPMLTLKLIGMIGNMRSDSMKDMSHGVIREEDWQRDGHAVRYLKDYYFGELDDIDAYQAYSLISQPENTPAWIGDGVVERESLILLSDRLYRAKPEGESRVHVIPETSHFQALQTSPLVEFADRIFK